MKTKKKKHLLIHSAIFCLLLSTGPLHAEDRYVSQLEYQNCGGYTVSKEWVNWKYKDENGQTIKKSKAYNREIRGYGGGLGGFKYGACFRLEDLGIPEGAEVWLSYQIAGGDKVGCRKDAKVLYKAKATERQKYKSKGTTQLDNRCRFWETKSGDRPCYGTYTPEAPFSACY